MRAARPTLLPACLAWRQADRACTLHMTCWLAGGPFDAYYEALSNLGSEYVRYSPWFPNPRVVVAELTPSDCTKDQPATNWNSTYLDAIMRDFMTCVATLRHPAPRCPPLSVSHSCMPTPESRAAILSLQPARCVGWTPSTEPAS